MKKLKILLQSNRLYLLILFLVSIYSCFYIKNYEVDHIYELSDSKFLVKVDNYKIDGNKLTIYSDHLVCNYYFKKENEKNSFDYSFGDVLMLTGKLKIPSNNTIPNTFNYNKYLYYRNIEYILDIDSISLYKKNNSFLYSVKNSIYKRISKIDNNEYIYALILGNNSYIDSDVYDSFKTSGIIYLLSFSSLYMNNYSNYLLKLLRRLKIGFKISFIIVILLILFILFISSFSISLIKALIIFIISSINKEYKLLIKRINIIILSLSIMLIINPLYIFYSGFLLSFSISFFISLFIRYNKKTSFLTLSIISFLSSFILIINSNYEINVISFINSIIFIPIMLYLMFPFIVIVLFIPKLSFLLSIITYIVKLLLSLKINITIFFMKTTIIEIIIYYLILYLSIRNKKYFKIMVLFLLILYFKPLLINENKVYFLDVSQGDSTLLVINHKSILIDTGGIERFSQEEWMKKRNENTRMVSSIIPFFKSVGLKKIDYLILTHGDYDHMGWSKDLVNSFKVKKVIFNCGDINALESELIELLKEKNIEYDKCINEINELYFLKTKEYDNENDNSSVIITEIDGYKFMFMGDASSNTEKEIMNKYNLTNIDVLKVGHHGSKTSSSKEFIDEINPKYSIISVGKNNRYGHPNKEVLNNLKNSKIYRTDEDGSIMFKLKNNKLKASIYVR